MVEQEERRMEDRLNNTVTGVEPSSPSREAARGESPAPTQTV